MPHYLKIRLHVERNNETIIVRCFLYFASQGDVLTAVIGFRVLLANFVSVIINFCFILVNS